MGAQAGTAQGFDRQEVADGTAGGDDFFALEVVGIVERRILGRENGRGVTTFGMHDADDLDRRTGTESEHVGRIAQSTDVHGPSVQCFTEGGGGRKLGELDVVGHVLQLARDLQQHFDRRFLIGHQQRLKVCGVGGCTEGEGAGDQQSFEGQGKTHDGVLQADLAEWGHLRLEKGSVWL
ncbi:hypothetical protein D3C75_1024620 [compost metagenome]